MSLTSWTGQESVESVSQHADVLGRARTRSCSRGRNNDDSCAPDAADGGGACEEQHGEKGQQEGGGSGGHHHHPHSRLHIGLANDVIQVREAVVVT